ncbi:MAG TPA: metallophosphoesterase [Solirubrobacteraceae bacterium]|nr:metallophosphoesterase [Solirubrobacteraceae bacterium]
MRTLIVSDLHLGGAAHADVLRRPAARAALFAELEGVERLVLLGDVLELRHGPRREALAVARGFFEELGRVFDGREVVVCAGNHDHALVEPWLARRTELDTSPEPLGVEQRPSPAECSSMMAALARWCEPARLTAAYPGLWVRSDVYATHGHYLDCHMTVPTIECLSLGVMGRMLGRPASSFTAPADYETVMGPVFAWLDAVARQRPVGNASGGQATVRAWRTLGGGGGSRRGGGGGGGSRGGGSGSGSGGGGGGGGSRGGGSGSGGDRRGRGRGGSTRVADLRARVLGGAIKSGFPLAVSALNRLGLGQFKADISSDELRRAGLRAMGEVAERLALGDAYVIFGHTHRTGPLPSDREPLWVSPAGARLMNTGCWTYDRHFLTRTAGESPYWPGGCVLVPEHGPPVLKRLLVERTHSELEPVAV